MFTRSLFASLAVALIGLGGCAGEEPAVPRASSSDPVFEDFAHRVAQYMRLRDVRLAGAQLPNSSNDVAANQASTDALAARIRGARAGARQGDIFTPDIAARLRAVLNPEVRGPAAADTRDVIRDDAPPKFTLRVNDAYPEGAPLPTVPPNVLAALPALPAALEYRIVDRHLILLDAEANIIVDYLFDVMCATC
jgi:hypothetical protein